MEGAALLGRLTWQLAEVVDVRDETAQVKTLAFDVPGWPGHRAGQHVDVRLTAEDGYQAERSYSIASPPEALRLALTVERLENGEVSPWLVDEARPGDRFELRGPIGGYFAWSVAVGGPLLLVATDRISAYDYVLPTLIPDKGKILTQLSLAKHPDLPDVPLIVDLAKNDEQRQILKLIFARQSLGRPYLAPPGVPAERVAMLRKAFMDTMADKEFLAEADKAQLEITPIAGEAVQKLVTEVYQTPAAVAHKAAEILR